MRIVILALCFFISTFAFAAGKNNPDRSTYVAAEKALKQNQTSLYQALKKQLEDDNYVLLPYLEYAELQKQFSQGEFPVPVSAFLRRTMASPHRSLLACRIGCRDKPPAVRNKCNHSGRAAFR